MAVRLPLACTPQVCNLGDQAWAIQNRPVQGGRIGPRGFDVLGLEILRSYKGQTGPSVLPPLERPRNQLVLGDDVDDAAPAGKAVAVHAR